MQAKQDRCEQVEMGGKNRRGLMVRHKGHSRVFSWVGLVVVREEVVPTPSSSSSSTLGCVAIVIVVVIIIPTEDEVVDEDRESSQFRPNETAGVGGGGR